ncbi:MAG TPA: hypothetical protein VKE24_09580 [Candidatus Acidoferrales bacterium]|nr:hypothetical protein [Candidatus Acidoferrales bacterium]
MTPRLRACGTTLGVIGAAAVERLPDLEESKAGFAPARFDSALRWTICAGVTDGVCRFPRLNSLRDRRIELLRSASRGGSSDN